MPKLLEFFRAHVDADFFCLREVWNGGERMLKEKSGGSWLAKRVTTMLPDIQSALPGFSHSFRPHFYDFYGLAVFFKKASK